MCSGSSSPNRELKADFDQLRAVLANQVPDRPVLFELFLNEHLYDRLTPKPPPQEDAQFGKELQVMLAYHRAGYDYHNLKIPGFDFPCGRDYSTKTVDLNEGGLITDWQSFENYSWPNPESAAYQMLHQLTELLPEGMILIIYGPCGVLENTISIIGFEALCFMEVAQPDLLAAVFNQPGSRLLRYYEIACQHPAVGACMGNDGRGFNTQTLLSPTRMRRNIFPWHKNIIQTVHRTGKPVIQHSCGDFEGILDDLDRLEIDARHSYEDNILPVEQAYLRYHDRFAALGGIDVDFLCRSSPEAVYQRASALLDLTAEQGGYAVGSGNSIPDYVPDENYFTMIAGGKLDGIVCAVSSCSRSL